MGSFVHRDQGQGPVAVLVHGVGVGPESFDRLARLLPGRRVVVVERPVGPTGEALPVEVQADLLAHELVGIGAAGGLVVGVSGGATLGVAVAIHRPEVVGALAVHEPLLGRHVPDLHDQFTTAAALAATGDEATMTVVRKVMGDATWAALGPGGRASSEAQAARWRAEIAAFAAFDPTAGELGGLREIPTLVTYGANSRRERRLTAAVLRVVAGADVAEVPGAANAAQLDAPTAYAALIDGWAPRGGGRA